MANEVGTASNLEDLFSKIVSFLTTNATLVGLGQQWQVMRIRRDNLLSITSSFPAPTTPSYADVARCCRYDPRQLNTDIESSWPNCFNNVPFTAGTSQITWRLRTARTVTSFKVRAPTYSSDVQYMFKNFRLQYSDDGVAWTTALTVNSTTSYAIGEWRTHAVTPAGSHEYWKIIFDSVQGGGAYVAFGSTLLLESDGTVSNHFGSEVIFKAPGTAGTDEIFTGIRSESNAADGWFNLFLNGYTGFDANEQSWLKQPGCLPGSDQAISLANPMIPCWNTVTPYWFVASGRSFRICVKISTNYEGGYLGFFLPYATPGQYPYPLAVGGSLVPDVTARATTWRYSFVSFRHGVFVGPGGQQWASTDTTIHTSLYIRGSDGSWRGFCNRPDGGSTSESISSPNNTYTAPYTATGAYRSVWPHCVNGLWTSNRLPYRDCLGGGYILQPVILLQNSPTKAVLGEFEGVYSISGYQNAPENTMTYNGKTVTVFQNAYRNTIHEFWALSLD